jgi:hypothetical protein
MRRIQILACATEFPQKIKEAAVAQGGNPSRGFGLVSQKPSKFFTQAGAEILLL